MASSDRREFRGHRGGAYHHSEPWEQSIVRAVGASSAGEGDTSEDGYPGQHRDCGEEVIGLGMKVKV